MRIITVHSFVDVITNSSTEMFVNDTDQSLELIEEILRDIIDTHNRDVEKGYLTEQDHELTFEEVFSKPYIYTQEMYNDDRWKTDNSCGYSHRKEENIGKIFIDKGTLCHVPQYLWGKVDLIFRTHEVHIS